MIKLNKIFVLGLYTYLRQRELSIDRVLDDSWEKFKLYFINKEHPKNVLEYLKQNCVNKTQKNRKSQEYTSVVINNNKLNYLLSKVSRLLLNRVFFNKNEFEYIYSTIYTFSSFYEKNVKANRKELIDLRINMYQCCKLLSPKLTKAEKNKAKYIEHFNQNEILKCLPLNKIAGDKWLKGLSGDRRL